MNRKKELTAIRDLIAHDNSQMRKDDGYIGDPGKLIRLTEKQAELAMHLGIPIGVCSQYDDYHGSRAGQYSYDIARTPKNLKYCLSQNHMENRASIYPYVPDPKRMYEYIRQVEGWGLTPQELRQSSDVGMEQLRQLARSIESRTDGKQQFTGDFTGGVCIESGSSAAVGLHMWKNPDYENDCYRLELKACIRKMGTYMSASELQEVANEVSQITKLLDEYEQNPITATEKEMAQWSKEIVAMQVDRAIAEAKTPEQRQTETPEPAGQSMAMNMGW